VDWYPWSNKIKSNRKRRTKIKKVRNFILNILAAKVNNKNSQNNKSRNNPHNNVFQRWKTEDPQESQLIPKVIENIPIKTKHKVFKNQNQKQETWGPNSNKNKRVFELNNNSNSEAVDNKHLKSPNTSRNQKFNNTNKKKNRRGQRKTKSPNLPKPKNKYRNIGTVQRKSIYLNDDSESSNSNSESVVSSHKPVPKNKTLSKISSSNKFIKNGFEEYEKPIEENKDQGGFDFEMNSERNPRYSCKSVQNTGWNNSPFQKMGKNSKRNFMKVKPFQPKFTSEKDFKVDPFNLNFNDQSWMENPEMGQDLNFENLMESGCFQLLNEKLTAFATGRFEPPVQLQYIIMMLIILYWLRQNQKV